VCALKRKRLGTLGLQVIFGPSPLSNQGGTKWRMGRTGENTRNVIYLKRKKWWGTYTI